MLDRELKTYQVFCPSSNETCARLYVGAVAESQAVRFDYELLVCKHISIFYSPKSVSFHQDWLA
jgi:hypothetical protein